LAWTPELMTSVKPVVWFPLVVVGVPLVIAMDHAFLGVSRW
jgi:hypothetical protein